MSKRKQEQDDTSRPPKRPKPENHQPPVVHEIEYARQLRDLLVFKQDDLQQLRNGIASFRAFLESVLYRKDEQNRGRQLSILREYLDTQKPADVKDIERPFLAQLWQAWSFAVQNHNDHIVSSVSSVLASLLKTLSSELDLREYGTLLCRTVLLHPHLRLVKRSLDAPKHKDFVISPSLRLLFEVASFDGGVFAGEVYKRREHTLDTASTRRNLGLIKQDIPEEELRRKPSIRTLLVRYILVLFRHLHEGAKHDLLRSRPLCISLFHHLRDDPTDLVHEILSTTEQHILKDAQIPRSAKATLLTEHNLERVTEVATRGGEVEHGASERAFKWLLDISTTSSYGVLRPSGWYPPGSTKRLEGTGIDTGMIDLGLDSVDPFESGSRPDVRNSTLLAWIQTLRPHVDLKERQLVLTCFEAAPELVAAYFSEKNLQMDPKLSNTWIGYASFLFEAIRLSPPSHLGNDEGDAYAEIPPPVAVILENLLPRPLTQKIITRCLNQSSDLITFFAVRLLVIAFQKLVTILDAIDRAIEQSPGNGRLWVDARKTLLSQYTTRCPSMKDVIATFRKVPDTDENVLQREAIVRLLRLYYELLGIAAREETFDVSSALMNALTRESGRDHISAIREVELEHFLVIAKCAPGMRWFTKHGSLQYSPIVMLLRLHAKNHQNKLIRQLVDHVLQTNSIVSSSGATDALVASLTDQDSESPVWQFLDECLSRASRAPVKYLDQLDQVSTDPKDQIRPSLLAAVVVEQLPFVSGSTPSVRWAMWVLSALSMVEGAPLIFKTLIKQAKQVKPSVDDSNQSLIEAAIENVKIHVDRMPTSGSRFEQSDARATLEYSDIPKESDNRPELLRWARKDLALAVEEGDVGALMLCFSSQHEDVRIQALAQLRLLRTNLQASSLDDKDSLAVLCGELVETYERQCAAQRSPMPYLATTFAARAVHVLIDPTHHIYPKLNRFLIKSPEWRINTLASHWLTNTVLTQPSEDDAYWKEAQWVLSWLVEALRTPADVEVFRRGDIFQKAMTLYASPAASEKLVKEKVLELLHRATCIEGGSNTLITRSGVLAWLDMQQQLDNTVTPLLRTRLLQACDQERVNGWSGTQVAAM